MIEVVHVFSSLSVWQSCEVWSTASCTVNSYRRSVKQQMKAVCNCNWVILTYFTIAGDKIRAVITQ